MSTRGEAEPESEMHFTTKQLSAMLGLSSRRVQQLAEEGILLKASRGLYKGIESIRGYISVIQSKTEAEEVELYKEKALHERAKREIAELKLAKLKNHMHDAADVEQVMTNMLVIFRSRILSIPDKVAPKVLGVKNVSQISDLINTEVLEALTELSEYDPVMFAGGGDDETEDNQPVSEDPAGSGTASETNDQ
ncbi:hypothetical protein [Paenibacillus naphthalenovorans]|uniref:hypothetical protein n=1 Tax=Paenibacillus naphthalenovorans TaxID=162209 RepID=UPI003D2E5874